MRLIKLDTLGYVNVNKIKALRQEDKFVVVTLTNGNYIRVKETLEEIIELIKQAKEI